MPLHEDSSNAASTPSSAVPDAGQDSQSSSAIPSSHGVTDLGPDLRGLLHARGIGRRDPKGGEWLIRDVNVTVNRGDRLAVLGPTGAGKTVLLRSLALLDPLDAGSIQWQERDIRGEAVPVYRTQVIYLHQRPALFDGTVEQNLRYPFTLKAHRGRHFDRERVIELLGTLERGTSFLEKASHDLSGGEAQIVALVRAVQLDPVILLLDEATASLDARASRAVENLIDGWFGSHAGERALVWVSHDHAQARRVANRSARMAAGRLEVDH